ncbi:MAG TPA: formyltransferase family protein [Steroidobacteraceae bacterium]|jgi:methionyl-tRNA formyltransferase|nr:formyltransferase family protein [Steroidobacteraceae bacterium]
MRFAITLTDRYLNVMQAFLARGWTPLKVFTVSVDQRVHRNKEVIELAQKLKVDVQLSRLSPQNLRELADCGCEALIVASYAWRISDWRPYLRYAVNFHPSPLPRGRGAYPAPVPVLEQSSSWGVACHKIEPEFDVGDVLKGIEFPMSPDDDHDSVDLKIQLANQRLAGEVADHFVDLWDRATPQAEGSYYPLWTEQDRSLNFTQNVAQILCRVRAFGPVECLATVNNVTLFVRRAVGWVESHHVVAGTVVYANGMSLVLAAADGFVALTEWTLLRPDAVTGSYRR